MTRMWQHWVNAILGLWVIAVPFIGLTGDAQMWTLVVSGIVIAALALWGALGESTEFGRAARLQHQM